MLHKELHDFALLLCSRGMRSAVNLVFLALLARLLGPSGMGEWAMVLGAGTLLHSLLLNWMHPPALRFGREEWRQSGFLSATWASRWPFLALGFLLAGLALLTDPAGWLNRCFHLAGGAAPLVFVSLLGLWLSLETQNLLRVRGAMSWLAALPVAIETASVLVLLALQAGWLSPHDARRTILLVQGGNALMWAAVMLAFSRRGDYRWRTDRAAAARNLRFAWPLVPGCLLGFASDWGDQLILRHFFASREVGLFQAAYQLMIMLLGFSALITTVLLPRLVDEELEKQGGAGELLSAAPAAAALSLYLVIPMVTLVPYLFTIFMGPEYGEAAGPFVILCAAVPGSLLAGFYTPFFNLQGRLWRSTVVFGSVKIALNLALSLTLAPRLGMIGSAISTAVSYALLQYLYLRDQHRFYGVDAGPVLAVFALVLCFSLGQALAGMALGPRLAVGFAALLVLTRVIRKRGLVDRELAAALAAGRFPGAGKFLFRLASRP